MVKFDTIKTNAIVVNTKFDFAFHIMQKYLPEAYDGYENAHLTFLKMNEIQGQFSGRKSHELYQNYHAMLTQYQIYQNELIVNKSSYIQNLFNILHVYDNQLKQSQFQNIERFTRNNFYQNSYIFRNMYKVSDTDHLHRKDTEHILNVTNYLSSKKNPVWNQYNQSFVQSMAQASSDTLKQERLMDTYFKETTYEAQSQLFYLIKTNLKNQKQEHLCQRLEERKYYSLKENLKFCYSNLTVQQILQDDLQEQAGLNRSIKHIFHSKKGTERPRIKHTLQVQLIGKNPILGENRIREKNPIVTQQMSRNQTLEQQIHLKQTWKTYIEEHASWYLQKNARIVAQRIIRQQGEAKQIGFHASNTNIYQDLTSYPGIRQIFHSRKGMERPRIKNTLQVQLTGKKPILGKNSILGENRIREKNPIVNQQMSRNQTLEQQIHLKQTWKTYIEEHASWYLQKNARMVAQRIIRQQGEVKQNGFHASNTSRYQELTSYPGIRQIFHSRKGTERPRIKNTLQVQLTGKHPILGKNPILGENRIRQKNPIVTQQMSQNQTLEQQIHLKQTWKTYIEEHASWYLQKNARMVAQRIIRQQGEAKQIGFHASNTSRYQELTSYPGISQIFHSRKGTERPRIKNTLQVQLAGKNPILGENRIREKNPIVTQQMSRNQTLEQRIHSKQAWKTYIEEHASWYLQKNARIVAQRIIRQQGEAKQNGFHASNTSIYQDLTSYPGISQIFHSRKGTERLEIQNIKQIQMTGMKPITNVFSSNEKEVLLYPQTQVKKLDIKPNSELEETSTLVKHLHNRKNITEQNDRIVSNDKLTEYFNIPEEQSSNKNMEIEIQNRKIQEFKSNMEEQIHSVKKELVSISQKKLEYSQIHVITKEVLKEMEHQLKLERMRRGID